MKLFDNPQVSGETQEPWLGYVKARKDSPKGVRYSVQRLDESALQVYASDMIKPDGTPFTYDCESELVVIEPRGKQYICRLADKCSPAVLRKMRVTSFMTDKRIVTWDGMVCDVAKWVDVDAFFSMLDKDDGGRYRRPYVLLWKDVVVDWLFAD